MIGNLALESYFQPPQLSLMFMNTFLNSWIKIILYGAVLIDLKKAFDTVDHKILLKKLWCYGFQNQSFDWFESYLTDRQQLNLVNNIMT